VGKKALTTRDSRQKRLKFCRDLFARAWQLWGVNFIDDLWITDETYIPLIPEVTGNYYTWGDDYDQDKIELSMVKHGAKVMVWGAFSTKGAWVKIYHEKGDMIMNGPKYLDW